MNRSLYAAIDAILPSYPYGIPRRLLAEARSQFSREASGPVVSAQTLLEGLPHSGVVIIGRWTPESPEQIFSGEDGALISAALERGMKIDRTHALTICAQDMAALEAALPAINSKVSSDVVRVVLVCGLEFDSQRVAEMFRDAKVIASPAVKEIRTDESVKRKFWSDLKQAMKVLEGQLGGPHQEIA